MAITIDYSGATKRIIVPQSDLTLISGSLYELNTESLRTSLKALEAGEDGIVFQDTHRRNAPYTVFGVTYAQSIEILNSTVIAGYIDEYEVFFDPDTQYSVSLIGSNNNIADIQNLILANNVTQVIPNNSAGLILNAGSAISEADKLDIADRVWDETASEHESSGTTGEKLKKASKALNTGTFIGLS